MAMVSIHWTVIVFDYDYSAAMTRNIGSPTREVFSIAESDMTARYGTVLTSPRRREVLEVPYDALREAVINAVAHRDYFEKGANVMVEMGW